MCGFESYKETFLLIYISIFVYHIFVLFKNINQKRAISMSEMSADLSFFYLIFKNFLVDC